MAISNNISRCATHFLILVYRNCVYLAYNEMNMLTVLWNRVTQNHDDVEKKETDAFTGTGTHVIVVSDGDAVTTLRVRSWKCSEFVGRCAVLLSKVKAQANRNVSVLFLRICENIRGLGDGANL